uniref:ABC transporter domain-containing protein n=1 Tax=Cryptomonas curvata TaxID=233186 RepID=A0A7S0ME68_9CRYP|mmetsp:Transcript_35661/g.74662  ORF Transcript_35661/g.74662 Transcript_35661/m.74662 type:complete len:672 (+) Transcript_35661:126-2141(+)
MSSSIACGKSIKTHRGRNILVAAAFAAAIVAYRRARSPSPSSPKAPGESAEGEKKDTRGAGIDRVFVRRLLKLLPVLVPSPWCKESFYLALVAVLMAIRTLCDVWQIRNGTSIETAIIARDSRAFRNYMGRFALAMLPIAAVNNLLKMSLNEIALCFRSRLTRHLYKQYLHGFTFYKISNLDNRITNVDQLLTQDVDKFANSLADLYSNLSKPILDILIYARKLSENVGGFWAPGGMLAYLAASGVFLTHLRRPLGKFTVKEQRLEGQLRHVSSRLISNSEEIAFYRGNERERFWLEETYGRIETHVRRMMRFRFAVGMVDTVVAKYIATIVGYYIVSRPLLNLQDPRRLSASQKELQEEYYRSGRMMLQMAQAVGRLILAGRELTRLAGFTARVDELCTVLQDLQGDRFQRTLVRVSSRRSLRAEDMELAVQDEELVGGVGVKEEVDGLIRLVDVPIVTPKKEILVRRLNMEVRRGMNTLICGPNGCGKSSLFRILGDLWPVCGGRVEKPRADKVFYVPQKPYLSLGTLRDQVIYPHCKESMDKAGRSDDDLRALLDKVMLGYLADTRDAGFDAREDWADVLSGGEKQRLAMARLYYHAPQFAILDECTSAVSVDVEGVMYAECAARGITLLTVSHRKSLWKYHQFVLRFDGQGEAKFSQIQENDEEFGS